MRRFRIVVLACWAALVASGISPASSQQLIAQQSAPAQEISPTQPATPPPSFPLRPNTAAPVGQWKVLGSNPGEPSKRYQGTVSVTQLGQTYRVVWVVGNQQIVGHGILFNGVFSVAYTGGIAVYVPNPQGQWEGQWSPNNGATIGLENWSR
ncbi:MAG: hypothetical protein AB7G15_11130 [Alphaproteobacteria bacterium]